MKKLIICALIITALALAASAAEIPAVTAVVENDAEIAITAAASEIEAPELGEWSAIACMAGDAESAGKLRTTVAIRATDLDFNDYTSMTYDDRVSVVIAMICTPYTDEMHSRYGEGETALSPAKAIMYTEPSGEYAIFTLSEGTWTRAAAFALKSDTITKEIITLDFAGLGIETPAFIAKYDAEAAEWHAVGVNQPYVDLIISSCF